MVTKKITKKKADSDDVLKYEMLVVYPLSVNEIVAEKTLADICKKAGFSIVEVDKWGVKSLAYEIKGENKGYYLRFILKGGRVGEIEKAMKIDDNMLRYIVVRI